MSINPWRASKERLFDSMNKHLRYMKTEDFLDSVTLFVAFVADKKGYSEKEIMDRMLSVLSFVKEKKTYREKD